MPQFQFSRDGIDPQYGGSGSPGLPAQINGQPVRHPVVITASALKPTKDQQGGYMELTITAIDGPCKGMEQIDRLNLQNKSADAVRIANQQLAAYLAVMGMYSFNATEEMHNKPFMLETQADPKNPNRFEVSKLFDVNGNDPAQAGSGAPANQGGGFGGAGAGGQGFGQPQGGQGFGAGQGQPPADQGQGGQQGGGAAPGSQPGWGQGGGQGAGQPQGGQWNQGGGQGGQGGGGQPGWGQR